MESFTYHNSNNDNELIERNILIQQYINFYSHKSELNKTLNRILFDSLSNIINNENYKNIEKQIRNIPDKNIRASAIMKVYRILKDFKININISEFAQRFDFENILEYNEISDNILNEIIYQMNNIEIPDINSILDDRMNKDNEIVINKKDMNNYFIGTQPIKLQEKIFKIKKVFKTNIINTNPNEKILNNNFNEYQLVQKNKLFSDETNNIYIKNKLEDKYKLYTIIHLNKYIPTWRIIAERKVNIIIQSDSLEYDNSNVIFNSFKFGNKVYMTYNKYENLKKLSKDLESYLYEFKGFNIIGQYAGSHDETFGYYITTYVNKKLNKLDIELKNLDILLNIPRIPFIMNKEITYNNFNNIIYPNVESQAFSKEKNEYIVKSLNEEIFELDQDYEERSQNLLMAINEDPNEMLIDNEDNDIRTDL